jgi:hypothetical protein
MYNLRLFHQLDCYSIAQLKSENKAVKSDHENGKMKGKINGEKNPAVRKGKRPEKNSGMVGNFPQGERKHLPVHGTFSIG